MTITLGIDPGLTGGLAILHDRKLHTVIETPTVSKELDILAISKFMDHHNPDQIIIEKVHAIFGASAGTTFKFGEVYGAIQALALSKAIPMILVKPKDWQKVGWQGITPIRKTTKSGKQVNDTKRTSLVAAMRLFPDCKFMPADASSRKKKMHDGMVDAALIAYYGALR